MGCVFLGMLSFFRSTPDVNLDLTRIIILRMTSIMAVSLKTTFSQLISVASRPLYRMRRKNFLIQVKLCSAQLWKQSRGLGLVLLSSWRMDILFREITHFVLLAWVSFKMTTSHSNQAFLVCSVYLELRLTYFGQTGSKRQLRAWRWGRTPRSFCNSHRSSGLIQR